jgi:nucleotide-binding universal stress UspA family protein
MFPTKILLATDGSAEAERAAQMAKTVSERLAVDGSEEAKQATKAAAELSGGTGSGPVLVVRDVTRRDPVAEQGTRLEQGAGR